MTLFVTQPQLRGLKVYRKISPAPRLLHRTNRLTPAADDEYRRNVQDLSDYRGIGAVAWGKRNISAATKERRFSVRSQENSKISAARSL
jgi:hypothetical protein